MLLIELIPFYKYNVDLYKSRVTIKWCDLSSHSLINNNLLTKLLNYLVLLHALKENTMEALPKPKVDDTIPLVEDYPNIRVKEQPQSSLHALSRFYTPQALKLIGYINHKKIIVLINSDI